MAETPLARDERMNAAYAVRYLSKTFWAGLFVGMFLFGIFTLIGIWITVQLPVALNDAPVRYGNIILPDPAVYCAGDTAAFDAFVEVDAESIINTYYSTINAANGGNVLGTQGYVGTRLYPQSVAFTTTIPFAVATQLAPGAYEHVRASIALNKDSEPAFIEVPFQVRECP